jgi:NADH-quinone oxidoreductase subunit A
MTELLGAYVPIAIFIGLALVIGLALLIAPFAIAYKNPDPEKLSAYECGFNAFDDARMKFDVRFYLVSILFIIFDLEVAFLFPWAVSFGDIGLIGFWSMMAFLGVLTVGFVYEWKKGALEWDCRATHHWWRLRPRESSIPIPASRLEATTRFSAKSTTNWPTRAFSLPLRTS